MWREEIRDCTHQNHLIRVRPSSAISPKYLALAWNSPGVADQLRKVASSTSGLHTLSTAKLKSVEIPLPPLAEQDRVVAVLEDHLSRLDAADRQLDAVAKRFDRFRIQLMLAVSSGRLGNFGTSGDSAIPPAAVGVIDEDLPTVPSHWRWTRLGEIAEVVGGVTKDAKKQSDPSVPEYPYLRVANVQRARLDLTDVTNIRVPPEKAERLLLRRGDVLLNEGGDRDKLGRGWVWEGQIPDCIHQNHVFRARIRDDLLRPELLAWHANSFGRQWCQTNGTQSVNLASISLSKIKLLPVPVPPEDEQLKLLEAAQTYFSLLDRCEQLVSVARMKSSRLRRTLLIEAFAGRLVAQDPSDESADRLLERIRPASDATTRLVRKSTGRAANQTGTKAAPANSDPPAHAPEIQEGTLW